MTFRYPQASFCRYLTKLLFAVVWDHPLQQSLYIGASQHRQREARLLEDPRSRTTKASVHIAKQVPESSQYSTICLRNPCSSMAMHLRPTLMQTRRQLGIAVRTKMDDVLRPLHQIWRRDRQPHRQHARRYSPGMRCSAGIEGEPGQISLLAPRTVYRRRVALQRV